MNLDEIPAALMATLSNVSDAANMPAALGPPNLHESLLDLHHRLLVTRAAMTRVSELVGELTLLFGRSKATLTERRGNLEDDESEVVSSKKLAFLTDDYSSAKEKNARLGAATLESRLRLRTAEKIVSQIDAALIYSRDRHRELDRAVRDIDTRLRILSFEGSLS